MVGWILGFVVALFVVMRCDDTLEFNDVFTVEFVVGFLLIISPITDKPTAASSLTVVRCFLFRGKGFRLSDI